MMKRQLSIILLLVACLCKAGAQEDLRTWDMGPLSWDDFTLTDSSRGEEHSYLEFFFGIADTPEGPWATAYMDTRQSWVDKHWRTDNELLYNQIIFDLVELQRRRMQMALDTLPKGASEPSADSVVACVVTEIGQLDRDTRHGTDSVALHRWADSLMTLLNEPSASVYRGTLVDDDFSTGGFLDGSFVGTTGALHRHFSHGGGFEIGVEEGWRRHFLTVGVTLGLASCRDSAFSLSNPDNDLYTGDALSILGLSLQYGFSVFDNDRFRITPFVGYGILGYYYSPDDSDESFGPTAGSASFGVDTKIHLVNSVSDGQRTIVSVSTRLYGTYSTFYKVVGVPAGFTINLSVGFSLLMRNVYYKH